MNFFAKSVLVGVVFLAGHANASVITFDDLTQANGSVFDGPYTESGYVISTVAGQVFEGHAFGNPAPSLVVGPVFGGSQGAIAITRLDGGDFKINSFDWTNFGGVGVYLVVGYFDGEYVLSQQSATDLSAAFATVDLTGTAVVDQLVFQFDVYGTSLNFDNVNLSPAVPEPANWALMIAGFSLVGAALRTRRRTTAIA